MPVRWRRALSRRGPVSGGSNLFHLFVDVGSFVGYFLLVALVGIIAAVLLNLIPA